MSGHWSAPVDATQGASAAQLGVLDRPQPATLPRPLRRPLQALITPKSLDPFAVRRPALPPHDPGGHLVTPRGCARAIARSRRAERRNHVWAIDFQFDETADQRRLKLTNIVDEYTREALAMRVRRHCTAEDLVTDLDRLVDLHGHSEGLRCDNGPELIAWALHDWCRLRRAAISYVEPGFAAGEPLRRELQPPRTRRTAEPRRLRVGARSASRCRGVAHRVQHLPTPRRARRSHASRSARRMDHRTPTNALRRAEPPHGIPSPSSVPVIVRVWH
jgi:hypothetical protein